MTRAGSARAAAAAAPCPPATPAPRSPRAPAPARRSGPRPRDGGTRRRCGPRASGNAGTAVRRSTPCPYRAASRSGPSDPEWPGRPARTRTTPSVPSRASGPRPGTGSSRRNCLLPARTGSWRSAPAAWPATAGYGPARPRPPRPSRPGHVRAGSRARRGGRVARRQHGGGHRPGPAGAGLHEQKLLFHAHAAHAHPPSMPAEPGECVNGYLPTGALGNLPWPPPSCHL